MKKLVVYSYIRILLSKKNKQIAESHHNIDKSHEYYAGKKTQTKKQKRNTY